AGKDLASLRDPRGIPLRQGQDEAMCASNRSGFDDPLIAGLPVEAANILGDCAVEQACLLRQISDVLSECDGMPLIETCAVEPNSTLRRLPNTYKRLCERGLSRAARAQQGHSRTCRKGEGDVPVADLGRSWQNAG